MSKDFVEYADRVRDAVAALNAVIKNKPAHSIRVRLDILDMSTTAGRGEYVNATITKEL